MAACLPTRHNPPFVRNEEIRTAPCFAGGVQLAECPQCSNQMPDAMRFCGFCGIELETGKKATTDRLLEYVHMTLTSNVEYNSDVSTKLIGSMTLAIGSTVTLVSNIPFDSLNARIFGILSLVGIVAGAVFIAACHTALGWLQESNRTFNAAFRKLLMGEISTASDFRRFMISSASKRSLRRAQAFVSEKGQP